MTIRMALLFSTVVACGGSGSSSGPDGGGGTGTDVSCTYAPGTMGSGTSCSQFHSVSANQRMAVQSACTTQHGTSGSSCSTSDLLGCCGMMQGTFYVSTCTYADSGSTATQEMSGCVTAGGTWSATP